MEAEGANAGSVQVSMHGTSGMKSASSGPSGCDWSMTTPRNESLKHESKSEGAKGATSVSEGAVIVGDNEEAAGDTIARHPEVGPGARSAYTVMPRAFLASMRFGLGNNG